MDTETIAAQWREIVVHPGPWTRSATQTSAQGICKGFEADCPDFPNRKVYLKPTGASTHPTNEVAAREKVAADLARDLLIPAPPVVLHLRPKADEPHRHIETTCVSLIMFSYQEPWWIVRDRMHALGLRNTSQSAFARVLPKAAGRMLAFGTWVMADDMCGDANSQYGKNPGTNEEGYVYFDYAHALGAPLPANRLVKFGFKDTREIPFPPEMKAVMDIDALSRTISSIEAFPEAGIENIVGRIPSSFLEKDVSLAMIEGLIARKALVRDILRAYF